MLNVSFESVCRENLNRYPNMTAQDFIKLAFQSEFGPNHMINDVSAVEKTIITERENISACSPAKYENISNWLCRFPIDKTHLSDEMIPLFARLFKLTAESVCGSEQGFLKKLDVLRTLPVSDMENTISQYLESGICAISHSECYKTEYHPHYRLLKLDFAYYFDIFEKIERLSRENKNILIAIDGCCAGGKSSLSEILEKVFPCRVFHTDDFYLPVSKRADNWHKTPAGNMDLKRLKAEVLQPAKDGGDILSSAFDCSTQSLKPPVFYKSANITIVEGSYCLHPELRGFFDLKLFLSCSPQKQKERLILREGDYFKAFEEIWIPLEQLYHRLCPIDEQTIVVSTDELW